MPPIVRRTSNAISRCQLTWPFIFLCRNKNDLNVTIRSYNQQLKRRSSFPSKTSSTADDNGSPIAVAGLAWHVVDTVA
jgi:hypothetical protein